VRSLSDLGADIVNEHGCIERNVVIAVERQQEMGAEPFTVVDFERSSQSGAQIPKPIRGISRRGQISRWVEGKSPFINLRLSYYGIFTWKRDGSEPGAMSQAVSYLFRPSRPEPVAQRPQSGEHLLRTTCGVAEHSTVLRGPRVSRSWDGSESPCLPVRLDALGEYK